MRHPIRFPPFHLDVADERLWCGEAPVRLRRKTFAALRYLAHRPNRLVTKAELLHAVWPDTHVSEVVLKVCVKELRAALGDCVRAPRFIQTVRARDYRFVAPIEGRPPKAKQLASDNR
jgi:DNA-binding winged helix-turn-helix (wHTH) protein